MSADLITYMLVGPQRLSDDPALRDKAVRQALSVTEAITVWWHLTEKSTAAVDDDDPVVLPPPVARVLRGAGIDLAHDNVDEYSYLLGKDPEKAVSELFELWNDRTYSDTNTRDFGTRQILVAGGTSWGDEPDTTGYMVCKRSLRLGLCKIYGIK